MTVSDEERLARALLTRVAEPGDAHLGRLIADLGAIGVVEALRAGTPPRPPASHLRRSDETGRRPDAGTPAHRGAAPLPKRPAGGEPSSPAYAGRRAPAKVEPRTGAGPRSRAKIRPWAPSDVEPESQAGAAAGPRADVEKGSRAAGGQGPRTGAARRSRPEVEPRPRDEAEPRSQAGTGQRWRAEAGPRSRDEAEPWPDLEARPQPRPEAEARSRAEAERRFAAWRARLPDADPAGLLAAAEALGGRLVCPGDAEWPSQLDDLGDGRPFALWVRGDLDLRFACLRSVAVVGSRSATSYGAHVAAELAAELAERGWCVVSGGAFGIDAAAHRGALAADAPTVAVFACGVDVAYPSAHEGLFADIARHGLLVSELPPGATPTRHRFLIRNRVIAALTRGTVVVEAARRSGALNTARHARDLHRAVMAVPGPVTSPTSAGCHALLREENAVCVTDAAEVLDLVGLIGDDLAPEKRGPVLARDLLDQVTRDVLEAVPARAGSGAAGIAVSAGVDLDTALTCLGALSAGGFVERCPKGWRLRRLSPAP